MGEWFNSLLRLLFLIFCLNLSVFLLMYNGEGDEGENRRKRCWRNRKETNIEECWGRAVGVDIQILNVDCQKPFENIICVLL